jgi:hypothetical protein
MFNDEHVFLARTSLNIYQADSCFKNKDKQKTHFISNKHLSVCVITSEIIKQNRCFECIFELSFSATIHGACRQSLLCGIILYLRNNT